LPPTDCRPTSPTGGFPMSRRNMSLAKFGIDDGPHNMEGLRLLVRDGTERLRRSWAGRGRLGGVYRASWRTLPRLIGRNRRVVRRIGNGSVEPYSLSSQVVGSLIRLLKMDDSMLDNPEKLLGCSPHSRQLRHLTLNWHHR
jgi:hypothetical protein